MALTRPALPRLFDSAHPGVRLAWTSLDALAADTDGLLGLLSAGERERARRFRFERDRSRYVAAHAVLRGLLAELTGRGGELRLVEDEWGKPRLAGPDAELAFNMAHTGGRALYGFGRGIELGVDAEALAPAPDLAQLARHVFAPAEIAEWEALSEAERTAGFFNGWTRKEAFVKALGRGLDYPLDSFAVSLAPGREARFVSLPDDAKPAANWRIEAFSPEPGYVAAVVARRLAVAPAESSTPGEAAPQR